MKISPAQLKERQAWSLDQKVEWALHQIRIWYDYWDGKVYVAFSGGKDSTVLLHLVRSLYGDAVPAVFCNTGLEFPEIVKFVKAIENVTILRPKMTYRAVIEKHGYPVVSKQASRYIWDLRRPEGVNPATKNLRLTGMTREGRHCPWMALAKKWRFLVDAPFKISNKCCDVMKKAPMALYSRQTGCKPYIGIMADDSRMRGGQYIQYGCNAFDIKHPSSKPLSVWLEHDVWAYIKGNDIPYSPIYDMGYTRTGCVFCAFGVHMEKPPNRFVRMKKTHPRLWKHCMDTLGMREVLKFVGVATGDK